LPAGCLLEDELHLARALMLQGAPLVHRLRGRAGWELRAVVQGGLRILDKLDQRPITQDHHTLIRPTLGKVDGVLIAWRCLRM
jgi:hypothetical protein